MVIAIIMISVTIIITIIAIGNNTVTTISFFLPFSNILLNIY